MLSRGIIAAVLGIALSAAVLAVTASGSTGASPLNAVTLHLVEHPVNEHVVDLPPKGDSQGDLFPFSNRLFDASNTHQVGRDQGNCIRTNTGSGEWQCSWTNKLANGTITVEGPFYDTNDSVLAIIGGTGQYRDARGQMLLHARSGGYDFVFSILH